MVILWWYQRGLSVVPNFPSVDNKFNQVLFTKFLRPMYNAVDVGKVIALGERYKKERSDEFHFSRWIKITKVPNHLDFYKLGCSLLYSQSPAEITVHLRVIIKFNFVILHKYILDIHKSYYKLVINK